MPNRILRDGILDSRPINSLSDAGEIFYRRLMSVVDDYGRFQADPEILRARLFPLALDRWPLSRVEQMLAEVCRCPTDDGHLLVSCYASDGQTKKYIQIYNFRQKTRSPSRYPGPTDQQMLVTCGSDVVQMRTYAESESYAETKADADAKTVSQYPVTPPLNGKGDAVVIRSRPEWESDAAFQAFASDYRRTGAALIDDDFREAFQWAWKPLDFEQRMERHKALIEKLTRGYFNHPQMVPRPKKFLLSEWKRPAVVPMPRKESRSEMLDRQAMEALEEIGGQ